MQVLIVDGSIQIIQRLEEILSEVTILKSVYSTVSYEEAIRILEEKKVKTVLLGISLQARQSLELVTEIKRRFSETLIIVLSNNMNDYLKEECALLGIDFFLDKYHDFEKIPQLLYHIGTPLNPNSPDIHFKVNS